jgi:hypothetical protein
MFTRRIITSACVLALAVPVAAGARPAFDQPTSAGSTPTSHGDTKYDLQNQQDLGTPVGVTGDTKSDITPANYADALSRLSAEKIAAAYGNTAPKVTPVAVSAPSAQPNDDTNGWRIAAVAEAGVLAALALGGGLAAGGHLRPRRRMTAA